MMSELTLASCETFLLDIPMQRSHHMSFGAPDAVNFVMVRLETVDGLVGWGEAATLGGPGWSAESSETIKVIIDRYIAPHLVGHSLLDYRCTLEQAFTAVRGNEFAKAAIEFAVMDIVGKFYQQPVYQLLGGAYRDAVDLSWSLASGDTDRDIAEAQEKMAAGQHHIFKLKFGVEPWCEDIKRLEKIRVALGDEAQLRVDVNQGWDRTTAQLALKEMAQYQPDFFEQPLEAWDLGGLALLRQQSPVPILADESFTGPHAAMEMIRQQSVDALSFKMTKLGGIVPALRAASLTETAGLAAYIGCMIETGIGTAAYLQFAAALPKLQYGCELFGPLMLRDD
ncbi:MAG: muconate/chloromuconate family cycloisomerase, partial [Thiolinea sp.]